jgi:hypothetical protein
MQLSGLGDKTKLEALHIESKLDNPNIGLHGKNQLAYSSVWDCPINGPFANTTGLLVLHQSPQSKARGETLPDLQYALSFQIGQPNPLPSNGRRRLIGVVQQNLYQDEGTAIVGSNSPDARLDFAFNYAVNFPDDRKAMAYNLLTLKAVMKNATDQGFQCTEVSGSAAWNDEATILANIDAVLTTAAGVRAATAQPFSLNWHLSAFARFGKDGDTTRATNSKGKLVSQDGTRTLQGLRLGGQDIFPITPDTHAGMSQALDGAHFAYMAICEEYGWPLPF